MLSSILSSLAFLAARVSAQNVSCIKYTPIGWNTDSNLAKVNYFDNNPSDEPANGKGFHADTLPANATISDSVPGAFVLSNHTTSQGTAFVFLACNVTSLGLITNTTQSSCSAGGCYHTYTNYVQIRDPAGENCLTISDIAANATNITFQPCLYNSTTEAQYFQTTQQVLYSPNYASITSDGTVELDVIQNFTSGTAHAWSLSRQDNLTVEVVESTYTQVGLSANLEQP